MGVNDPAYVLGLSYSHDASACLLKEGQPIVAIQKERLTRRKHDGAIHDLELCECIEYCLSAASIRLDDIALVVENSPTILYCRDSRSVLGMNAPRMLDALPAGRVRQISHHLAHAYAAYGSSPFNRCACLVIDGQGNYFEDLSEDIGAHATVTPDLLESSYIERQSVYVIGPGGYQVLRKDLSPIHKSFVRIGGVGHLYETVSRYVFRSRHDAGKLMGLAPYGKPRVQMMSIGTDATLTFTDGWIAEQGHRPMPTGDEFRERFEEYADLAAAAQDAVERAVLAIATWARREAGEDCLAYSGGVALNCAANSAVESAAGFRKMFVTPPASDAGISLGCAYYGHLVLLGGDRQPAKYSDYLGREYTEKELTDAMRELVGVQVERPPDIAGAAARRLADGQIGGWYQGRSEFGPRALGNRSIIADPRHDRTRDLLNRHIKQREAFRPFAPSVLAESVGELLDGPCSPYMLATCRVRPAWRDRLAAVTHVDATARAQSVEAADNPTFHHLISSFAEQTSVPAVLNTSFNGRAEPIVESPSDAVRSFLAMPLDFMALGPYLIRKDRPAAGSGAGG